MPGERRRDLSISPTATAAAAAASVHATVGRDGIKVTVSRRNCERAIVKMIRLYGVPLSQPVRAIAWACLMKHKPFNLVLTVPGSAGKSGSKADSFLSKNPLGQVPLLEEDSGFMLAESSAILTYLCEKHAWDLYPSSAADRARVNSYLHWHHSGTRQLARVFGPMVRPDLKVPPEEMEQRRRQAQDAVELFERAWLASGDGFIAGLPRPSIADLLAYEEVAQALPEYLNLGPDLGAYPRLLDWIGRMKALPKYEPAHVVLATLGDLTAPAELPLPKRLGAATKAAMQAYTQAQAQAL